MNTLTFDKGLIKEIQEWAYVYFVKLVRGRPLFVSKKNQEVKQMKQTLLYDKWYQEEKQAENSINLLDDIIGELADLESIKYGTEKQRRWASYIFSDACRSLAIDILEKRITEDEAVKILTTNFA